MSSLTETEKKELKEVKEFMIFDVRYKKIQSQCTVPNSLRIELDSNYSHETIRDMIQPF